MAANRQVLIFDLPPDRFDLVEIGTVRGKEEEVNFLSFQIRYPLLNELAFMDRIVVEHDHAWLLSDISFGRHIWQSRDVPGHEVKMSLRIVSPFFFSPRLKNQTGAVRVIGGIRSYNVDPPAFGSFISKEFAFSHSHPGITGR